MFEPTSAAGMVTRAEFPNELLEGFFVGDQNLKFLPTTSQEHTSVIKDTKDSRGQHQLLPFLKVKGN